jgi:hypothetical protein
MRRTCARPGCHEVASTTLSYDYSNRSVWLESLTEEPHPMVHDLCDRHGDTLSVPRGWLLRDQRPTVTPLFAGADRPPVVAVDRSIESARSDVMGELPFRRAATA